MAAGDVYKVRIFWDNAQTGKQNSTGLHVEQTDIAWGGAAEIGPHVVDWWNTAGGGAALKEQFCDDVALQRVTVQRVDPFEPLIEQYLVSPTIVGTLAGDMAPAGSAPLFSLRTDNAGKRYRGRMYLPPTGEGRLDAQGNIPTVNAEDMVAQTESFFAALDADGARPVVYSSEAQVVPHTTPPTYLPAVATPITLVLMDRRPRSQRRRTLRAGAYVTT